LATWLLSFEGPANNVLNPLICSSHSNLEAIPLHIAFQVSIFIVTFIVTMVNDDGL